MLRFLASQGWHLTSEGALVYNRRQIERAAELRRVDCDFSQCADGRTHDAAPAPAAKEDPEKWTGS